VFVDSLAIDYFSNTAILARINAEKDTLAAQKYHVTGYPMTILINKDGTEIDRLIGYAPTQEYVGTLEGYAKGIGTLTALRDSASKVVDRNLYFVIADRYKYRGDIDSAATWYGKIVDAGQPTDSMSGESRVAEADMYRREKHYDEALKAFKGIATDFDGKPQGIDASVYTGIVYLAMGDTTNAVAAYQTAADKYPASDAGKYAAKQVKTLTMEPNSTE